MLATATHDTKRGEDTRARLNVLSEIPDEWARRVARWHIYNRTHRTEVAGASAPSLNDEYLLYQSILGTWPMPAGSILRSNSQLHDYVERVKAYAVKASREAKLASSWVAHNAAYEAALCSFIDGIFSAPRNSPFINSFMRFLPSIQRLGAINGLSQLVLKSTLPGVPDFYQGSEFWDLSLVDPDNRRPVDFDSRATALAATDFATALSCWREGWLKLWVMQRVLDLRQRLPNLFCTGSYEPLTVDGSAADCILAFQRCSEQGSLVVLACRLLSRKMQGDLSVFWSGSSFLADNAVRGVESRRWVDQITGSAVESCSWGIVAAQALSTLPVAVLLAD